MLEAGRAMGSPSHVPHVRPRGLLRLIARPARDRPLRGDGAPAHAVGGAGRDLGVVLRDRQGFETAEVALEDPPAHEADQLESARPFVDALYREFLGRGIEYFFPEARLEMLGAAAGGRARAGELEFDGFGFRYRLSTAEGAFSTDEARLLDS